MALESKSTSPMDILSQEVLFLLLKHAQNISIVTLLALSSTNRAFRSLYTSSPHTFPILEAKKELGDYLVTALKTVPFLRDAPSLSPLFNAGITDFAIWTYPNLPHSTTGWKPSNVKLFDVQRALVLHPLVEKFARFRRAGHEIFAWGDRDSIPEPDLYPLDMWIKSTYHHLILGSNYVGETLYGSRPGLRFEGTEPDGDITYVLLAEELKQWTLGSITEIEEEVEELMDEWAESMGVEGNPPEFLKLCLVAEMIDAKNWERLGRYLNVWDAEEDVGFFLELEWAFLNASGPTVFDRIAEQHLAWVEKRTPRRIELIRDWLKEPEMKADLKFRMEKWWGSFPSGERSWETNRGENSNLNEEEVEVDEDRGRLLVRGRDVTYMVNIF